MSHLSGLACEQALFRISASEANRARTREQGAPASVYPSALRRRRQRQLQSNRIRLAKQQLCTCITLFCTLLCRSCTTTTWNDQILSFFDDGNGKAINSTISFWNPLFSSNITSLLLSNWATWDNREMVWKDAGAIFQRRCHGRRRCLIVRSLLISPKWRDCSQAIPIVNFLRSSDFSQPIQCFWPLSEYQPYWWLIINARDQFCWIKVNCKWFIEELYKLNLFYFRRNNGIVQEKSNCFTHVEESGKFGSWTKCAETS